jgi:exodeoxyribonuclease-5
MFEKLKGLQCDIIFLGDEAQLPPVKEYKSEVFKANYETFTFEKNERLENCNRIDIYNLNKLREQALKDTAKRLDLILNTGENHIKNAFTSGSDAIVLAYTNKKVDYWNKFIRRSIFGDESCNKYNKGEKLIFSGFRKVEQEKDDNGKTTYLKYYSSTKIEVHNVSKITKEVEIPRCCDNQITSKGTYKYCKDHEMGGCHNIKKQVTFYKLTDGNATEWLIPVTEKDNKMISEIAKKYKQIGEQYKEIKKWKQYYSFINSYLPDLNYSYALTVHKSQGSAWDKVFIDVPNIRFQRNLDIQNKMLYTAVSRMRGESYFLK